MQGNREPPFLTYAGWTPLVSSRPGARVAIPRTTPGPLAERPMPEHEIIMLAHLLGDGSFVKRQPIRYASVDEENLASRLRRLRRTSESRRSGRSRSCTVARRYACPPRARCTHGRRNPIAEWLDALGTIRTAQLTKSSSPIRSSLYRRSRLALFLRHLWATDGSVTSRSPACQDLLRVLQAGDGTAVAHALPVRDRRRLRAVGNSLWPPPVDRGLITGVEELFCDVGVGVHGLLLGSCRGARDSAGANDRCNGRR